MSQQQQYELVYLPAKGKANMIRLMLEDQGIAYKCTTIPRSEWPASKSKYPFGQVPALVVNGNILLVQSHTIARYLAREHGLLGNNSLEQAQVELWVDQTLDIRTRFLTMLHTNYEALLAPFLAALPAQLAPFEARLASQPEGARHLVLDRLTLADYATFDLLYFLQALRPECLSTAPTLKAFYDSFAARPKIRAYMESDEFKSLRTTGSPHLP